MLEKKDEIMYFDAHFHFTYSFEHGIPADYSGCTCAHSINEWQFQLKNAPKRILLSYGIHPQSCASREKFSEWIVESEHFLEKLAEKQNENRLVAIGEAGFDYFTEEFSNCKAQQEEAWIFQLELAKKYKLPLVVHCRKANHKLFEYSAELKKLPSVLFHSFMGPVAQAKSLLNRGINAYFSFGKQMLNSNKKVIECTMELPSNSLLLETDAPFQFLKNEAFTAPDEIKRVYKAAFELRKDFYDFFEFCHQIESNYKNMFGW